MSKALMQHVITILVIYIIWCNLLSLEEYIPSQSQPQVQTRSNNQRREEGHAKFGNGHHREDPLLLNHNHNNNNHYYDNNQRRFHNTKDQLREDFASNN